MKQCVFPGEYCTFCFAFLRRSLSHGRRSMIPLGIDGNAKIAGVLDRERAPYLTAGVSSTSWETELPRPAPGQGVGGAPRILHGTIRSHMAPFGYPWET